MTSIRQSAQHHTNPLHLFCRLRDCGVPKWLAKKLSAAWERLYRRAPWRGGK